jgi:hypothetical protein
MGGDRWSKGCGVMDGCTSQQHGAGGDADWRRAGGGECTRARDRRPKADYVQTVPTLHFFSDNFGMHSACGARVLHSARCVHVYVRVQRLSCAVVLHATRYATPAICARWLACKRWRAVSPRSRFALRSTPLYTHSSFTPTPSHLLHGVRARACAHVGGGVPFL